MPEFKAHLAAGVLSGGAVAAWGVVSHDLNLIHAGAVTVLGTTGGLLPDLDSDSGKPLALLFQLISILFPVLLYPYIRHIGRQDIPFLLCYYPTAYLFINYGVMPLVKRFTRHRGMMHSFPFAIVSGEAAFLILLPSGMITAIYGGLAVLAGCLTHLILDELSAMSLAFGFIPAVKRSTGSALKLKGMNLMSTLFIYALMITMGVPVTAHLLPVIRPFFHKIPFL